MIGCLDKLWCTFPSSFPVTVYFITGSTIHQIRLTSDPSSLSFSLFGSFSLDAGFIRVPCSSIISLFLSLFRILHNHILCPLLLHFQRQLVSLGFIFFLSFFFLWFLLLEDQTFCLSLMAIKVFERMKVVVDDHDAFTQQKIEMKSTKMLLSWLLSFTMQTSIYFVWFIDKLSKSLFYFSFNCPVVTKSRKDVCFNRFWPKNCLTFTRFMYHLLVVK